VPFPIFLQCRFDLLDAQRRKRAHVLLELRHEHKELIELTSQSSGLVFTWFASAATWLASCALDAVSVATCGRELRLPELCGSARQLVERRGYLRRRWVPVGMVLKGAYATSGATLNNVTDTPAIVK